MHRRKKDFLFISQDEGCGLTTSGFVPFFSSLRESQDLMTTRGMTFLQFIVGVGKYEASHRNPFTFAYI